LAAPLYRCVRLGGGCSFAAPGSSFASAERVEARGVGEFVLLDGAADGCGYCGEFGVGKLD
jgi:hypothetical protein